MQEDFLDEDVAKVLEILEDFAQSEESRMKVQVTAGERAEDAGKVKKQYHHGRCDIGSPWATGEAFDVLEEFDGKVRLDEAGRIECQ